jgi:hypothetical protein
MIYCLTIILGLGALGLPSADTADALILLMQAIMIVTMLTVFEFHSRGDQAQDGPSSTTNSLTESRETGESGPSIALSSYDQQVSHEPGTIFDQLHYPTMRSGTQE